MLGKIPATLRLVSSQPNLRAAAPAGTQGPTGPQGKVGPVGKVGPRGPEGPRGVTGTQGKVGPVGKVGPQGPEGLRGVTGTQGKIGPEGKVGPQGPAVGPTGQNGSVGEKGATGPTGQNGSVGEKGATGPAGQGATNIDLKNLLGLINGPDYYANVSTGIPTLINNIGNPGWRLLGFNVNTKSFGWIV